MIPIGIVTCDRHKFLDVTLRSLSATRLPQDISVTIFDGGSRSTDATRYLYSSDKVPLHYDWPNLPFVAHIPVRDEGVGPHGKIPVHRYENSLGVVQGSCRAICALLEKQGAERGIITCQDDVIFCSDWYTRLIAAAEMPAGRERPVGLIAGLWLNRSAVPANYYGLQHVPDGGVTAQIYYILPAGLEAARNFLQNPPADRAGFDNKFCAAVRTAADVYVITPAVGQHIGITSSVRPNIAWQQWHDYGRLDITAEGPFALAPDIGNFMP